MNGDHQIMKMTRRHFMELIGVLRPVVLPPGIANAQVADFSTFALLIDDLPNNIDPLFLKDVLSQFFSRNIPVCCVVDIAALQSGRTEQLVAQINATMQREVGLFEIILAIGDLGDLRRYFQMRSAESLRAAASALFTHDRDQTISCVLDRRPEDLIDLSAYGSAGFRY
jgi:hypothetical protein